MRKATNPGSTTDRRRGWAPALWLVLFAQLALVATGGRAASAASDGTEQIRIPVPVIRAAGEVERHGQRFALAGIAVTDPDETCGEGAAQWPCGRMALTAIRRFVRMRTLLCEPVTTEDAAAGRVNCTLGGEDIASWLVTHGWARSGLPVHAEAEEAAKEAGLGLWSPCRPGIAPGLTQASISDAAAGDAAVYVEVDISDQQLTLVHRGAVVATWPVSTARRGKVTPVGRWRAQWLSRHHRSSLYNNAPMPYSVFFNGDYAVHGTNQTGRLGSPASAGCVRLSPEHAAVLFDLASREGPANTLIVVRP